MTDTNLINKQNSGSTLIEVLLYVGIAATILLGISVLIAASLESRVRNQVVSEVESQGLATMETITQTVRNAQSINFPAVGAVSSTLTLVMALPAVNPTTFNLATGTIRITEAANPPVALTNQRVIVSDLIFSNLSRTGTPGTIRIQFTLIHINPQNRNEYNYSRTFTDSASIR